MKRRILSMLCNLALLVTMMPVAAAVDRVSSNLDRSTYSTHIANGFLAPIDDPDTNAVHISTAEELNQVRNNLNGSYVLVNDIDLSNYEWTPIGKTLNEPFRGKLDGQGFTISGLKVESNFTAGTLLPPSYAVGLFGVCDGAQIKNIKLQNVSVRITNSSGYRYDLTNIDSGNLYAGAFSGYAIGNTILYNSFVEGGMVFAEATGEAQSCPHAGGLIGFAKDSVVSFCHNNSSVLASYNSGLFGFDTYVGGLVASISGDGVVDRSFNSGSVTTDMGDFGTGYAGGLIGVSKAVDAVVTDCFNEASVSSCAGKGIWGGDDIYAGGIAAFFSGKISRAYSSGSISAQCHDPIRIGSGSSYVGGICARAEEGADIQSVVMLSTNISATSGARGSSYVYCIANGGTHNNTAALEGFPQGGTNDAQIKIGSSDAQSQVFYEEQLAWDFSTVWGFDSNKPYPQLKIPDLDNEDYRDEYLAQHLQFIQGSTYDSFLNSQRWAQIYWSEENNFQSNSAGLLYEAIDGIITGDNLKFSKLLGKDSLYQIILADYITDQSVKTEIEKSFEAKLPQMIEKTYNSVREFIKENWEDAWGELSDEDIFYLLHYDEKPAEDWINENFEKHLDELVYNDRHGLAEALEISADHLDKVLDAKNNVEKTVDWFNHFVEYSANVNAYQNADDEFQIILQKMLNHIPDGDPINASLLKKAISGYTAFEDEAGIEHLFLKFANSEITSGIGDNISKRIDSKITNWLDEILPDGAKKDLSILKWTTDKTWKICELVTKNGDLNDCRQMLHSNAFFESALYVTMQEIKDDFLQNQTIEKAELFDSAFKFFKEVQLYSMDVCVSYFDTYQTAWLPAIRHLSNTFLNSAIEEVQYNKLVISNTYCHGKSYFVGGKVITIACPTDVFLFDESENTVSEIVDNEVTRCAENISACAIDSVKIIAVPLDQEYRIQIRGTGTGYMDYSISEYDSKKCFSQAMVFASVPLSEDITYSGIINNGDPMAAEDYALSSITSSISILPNKVVCPDSVVPVQNVCIRAKTTSLLVGDAVELESEIFPHDASIQSLVWHSSDPDVIHISEEGQITAIAEGEATITAQSIYGGTPGQITFSVRNDSEDKDDEPSSGSGDSNEEGDVSPPDSNSSSGGGGGSGLISYEVYIASGIENGTVTASPKNTSEGKTVIITVAPDSGYELASLTATDKNGKEVKITDKGDGKFTFKMPVSKVTVMATFTTEGHKCPSAHFTDVDFNAWYHEAMDFAVSKGLMEGVSDIRFAPGGTTTRAQIVTILHRLEESPAVTDGKDFADVTDDAWYTDAVAWASANNVVDGYDDGTFRPNASVTREQMAAILHRYAQAKGMEPGKKGDLHLFLDGAATSAWAKEDMEWAVGNHILNGSGNQLLPRGSATRVQIAQIFLNFMN